LIARQRQNLQRTFVQSEQSSVDARAARRLAQTERELAAATAEFTAGLEQRFGPVPCLHEAHDAMELATTALDQKDVKAGSASEEAALAGLIKARQNLRQFLKDSSSASACRKFDAQQKQKLRKPPPKDDKAELAKLPEEIEKLAKEEKKIAEAIRGKSSSSKGEIAESQEKAAAKAEELRQLVRKDEALTDLARERMDAAADAVRDSARSLKDGREPEAGRKAAEAAEQLARLARQVAALKAADLNARLARSQALARELARQQRETARGLQKEGDKSGAARGEAAGQRGRAEDARTLADLLNRLREDATGTSPQLGEALRQAAEDAPPSAVADQMRRAADALQAGQADRALPDVDQSARMLGELAKQLDAARRALVEPQLAKLMAAEKQAASTQKALGSVHDERQKAAAEKKVSDLRDTMEALRPAEGKLAEAAAALAEAVHRGGNWSRRHTPSKPPEGLYVPPVVYDDSVKKVVQALQVRIQEIILQDALLDRDEAVPPQYRMLVEEYYRLLAEDLR
jgi:hypothetical protein